MYGPANRPAGGPPRRGFEQPWLEFPVTMTWDAWMDEALAEAAQAPGHGDAPVGAVLVGPQGRRLAAGRNRREQRNDPTAHAEMLVLSEAARRRGGWRLEGCTLVVTLEPCAMCAGAAVLARLERIVYGASDPKAGAAWSLYNIPQDRRLNHRIELSAGVREAECAALLTAFFEDARRGRVQSRPAGGVA